MGNLNWGSGNVWIDDGQYASSRRVKFKSEGRTHVVTESRVLWSDDVHPAGYEMKWGYGSFRFERLHAG